MNDVLNFLKKLNISQEEKVVIACSGGPDSMFLLNLLREEGYHCVCAHVNHKIRSESDDEYIFLEEYCNNYGIIFEGAELDGYSTGNFENYARNFRYSFFEKILKKYDSKYLFTAHHGDDLVETILMRLVRGSSLKGYAGFSTITVRNDYEIIRPLVYLTKDFIENYNKKNNIPFVVDYTNELDDYTRNRFRHKVLPSLKEEDNLVHLRFLKFSNDLKKCVEFINNSVSVFFKSSFKDDILDLNEFKKLDNYLQRQVIDYLFKIYYPDNLYLINGNHIDEVMKIIFSNRPNIELLIPDNKMIIKEYDKLYFTSSLIKSEDYEYIFEDKLSLSDGEIIRVKENDSKSNYVIRLSSKDIKLPIKVRNQRTGDKMRVKNMNGTKKINDIFIDAKISKQKRKTWPIITDATGEILWVPGIKKSNFDIPIDAEYDIILEYKKGEKIYEQKN